MSGTDSNATMVPIQVIRWFRFVRYSGTDSPILSYYTTAYSSQNAFSDFAGPNNTKVLIDLTTAQTDWKTKDVAITDSYNSGYYPAACCCARFGAPDNSSAPKGTNSFLYHYNNNPSYDYTKGVNYTWYFPAMGELGFIMPHLSKNDATLTKLASLYTDMNIASVDGFPLWSSSEDHNDSSLTVITTIGYYCVSNKKDHNFVRSFCAV